jgi:hypothetical protein
MSQVERTEGLEEKKVFQKLLSKYQKIDIKPEEILLRKVSVLDDAFLLDLMFTLLERIFDIKHYKIGSESVLNNEYWAVKYGPNREAIVDVIGKLADGGILDQFRREQELMENVVHQAVLKMFFDTALYSVNPEDEEYPDSDEDEAKNAGKIRTGPSEELLRKRGTKMYQRFALQKFGHEVKTLKLRDLVILGFLLFVGITLALSTFTLQRAYNKYFTYKMRYIKSAFISVS